LPSQDESAAEDVDDDAEVDVDVDVDEEEDNGGATRGFLCAGTWWW
jgi:hypothetical protein